MMKNGQEPIDAWGLTGHDWAVQMLRGHILHDSTRHAYLFTGPAGVGRRTLAMRFIQAMTCARPPAPAVPCGTCQTCKQIEAERYADLTVVQAEKAGGIMTVEQIRLVRKSIVLKPYQGDQRFALFLRFEEANQNAANALLKTLEEAPAHAVLILTAEDAGLLLPTIVSRCECLRLRPQETGVIESALKARGADEEQAHLLAHLSGGRPGTAFHLFSEPKELEFRGERLDDLETLLSARRIQKFAYAGKITNRKTEDRERPRETLLTWLSFWRDVMIRASGSGAALVNVDRIVQVEKLADLMGLSAARQIVVATEKALKQFDQNVNPRLLFEVLLLDLPKTRENRRTS